MMDRLRRWWLWSPFGLELLCLIIFELPGFIAGAAVVAVLWSLSVGC